MQELVFPDFLSVFRAALTRIRSLDDRVTDRRGRNELIFFFFLQDLETIYYGLAGLDALAHCSESVLISLCKIVRYEHHQANDVLF